MELSRGGWGGGGGYTTFISLPRRRAPYRFPALSLPLIRLPNSFFTESERNPNFWAAKMSGKGAKGLIMGKSASNNKDKDKKKPVSRSSRAGLQVYLFYTLQHLYSIILLVPLVWICIYAACLRSMSVNFKRINFPI